VQPGDKSAATLIRTRHGDGTVADRIEKSVDGIHPEEAAGLAASLHWGTA
jgi:hypothetical protein